MIAGPGVYREAPCGLALLGLRMLQRSQPTATTLPPPACSAAGPLLQVALEKQHYLCAEPGLRR